MSKAATQFTEEMLFVGNNIQESYLILFLHKKWHLAPSDYFVHIKDDMFINNGIVNRFVLK